MTTAVNTFSNQQSIVDKTSFIEKIMECYSQNFIKKFNKELPAETIKEVPEETIQWFQEIPDELIKQLKVSSEEIIKQLKEGSEEELVNELQKISEKDIESFMGCICDSIKLLRKNPSKLGNMIGWSNLSDKAIEWIQKLSDETIKWYIELLLTLIKEWKKFPNEMSEWSQKTWIKIQTI